MDFIDQGDFSDGNLKIDSGEKIDEVILLLNLEDGDPLYVEFSNAGHLNETIRKTGGVIETQCFSFLGIMFTFVAPSPFDFQCFDARKRIAKAVITWILEQG